MPEADWWLCDRCQSLNNLSARKCYSCHRRKPKTSQRASQYLNYVPVITWDRRVRFEDPPSLAVEIEQKHLEVAKRPPPLREPVWRHITAVAPPVPYGVRMTYRAVEPPPPPMRPLGPAPDSPLARVVGVPVAPYPPPGPPRRRLVAIPVGPPRPPQPTQRPPVAIAVGPGPQPHGAPQPQVAEQLAGPPPQPQARLPQRVAIPVLPDTGPPEPTPAVVAATAGWSHWRELLDTPKPDPERLRRAFTSKPRRHGSGAEDWPDEATAAPSDGARVSVAEPEDRPVDWPAEDLGPQRET